MLGSTATDVPKSRRESVDRHRDINVQGNWSSSVIDNFEVEMLAKHIDVHSAYFTGFWSQGDGASFTGRVTDTEDYLHRHHPGEFPTIRRFLDVGGSVDVSCYRAAGSHYVHENTVYVSVDTYFSFSEALVDNDPLRTAAAEALDALLDKELRELEATTQDKWRRYMKELYTALQDEHEYLTSDEAVWNTIKELYNGNCSTD